MSKKTYVVFVVLFFLSVIFFNLNNYIHVSDDVWFSARAVDEVNYFSWVFGRYLSWSSRVPIELLLISLINHYHVWLVLNSLFVSLMLSSVATMSCKDKGAYNTNLFILIFILALIPTEIFHDAVIWMTGSINYLWPTALMLGAYCLLFSDRDDKAYYSKNILLCILFFLSSFNEQIVVANIIILCLYALHKKINGDNDSSVLYPAISVFIVFIFIATCPGNKNRYILEIPKWFVDYNEISIYGRVLLGLNLYVDMLLSHGTIIPSILAMTLGLICKNKYASVICYLISIIFIMSYFMPKPPLFFMSAKLNSESIFSLLSCVRAIFGVMATLGLILSVLISRKMDDISVTSSMLVTASMASIVVLGLSPTVYASGGRVFFIPYILYCVCIVVLISYQNKSGKYK